MKRLLLATIAAISSLSAQLPAYQLYEIGGKSIDFDQLVAAAARADVVLFGELHNNAIAHWLELELAKALEEELGQRLVMGGEMFETDGQLLMDEYLSGLVAESYFEKEAKLWNNYATDYKPLVVLAKDKGLPFVCTNIPRRYAGMVAKNGLESLDHLEKAAKGLICPLPLVVDPDLPGYKALHAMGMGGHGSGENLMNAQAIKDATMAHHILANRDKDQVFLHVNGAYHSNNHEGIVWYLLQKNPKLRIITISTIESSNPQVLDEGHHSLADFIVNIDEDVTKTY
ncbi:MAG: ChaN family lipoprotein [Bacteroidetes bacterium]|jgi:uncharacterized iron-regulated protein|nr:ChaN family lipoprotein [Bacteroidota bacterium]